MSFFKTITTKPWEKKGVIGGLDPEGAINAPNEKVALSVFLVVISVVFSLFTVGYFLRMELPDCSHCQSLVNFGLTLDY